MKNRASLLAVAVMLITLGVFFNRVTQGFDGKSSSGSSAQTHADIAPHSPNLQSFGDFHAEATMDEAGRIEVHFYDLKASQLMPLPVSSVQDMAVRALPLGDDGVSIAMTPAPYPGEAADASSRFVGAFERRPDQKQVSMTITLPFQGHTYRMQWTPQTLVMGALPVAHGDAGMPAAASTDEAKKLFLEPGGLYSAADVATNGSVTAAEKYAGQMAQHNMNPAPGAKICPITNTAADDRFVWTVGGKEYKFCCTPCIEEFVRKAKQQPDTILAPEKYVKTALRTP